MSNQIHDPDNARFNEQRHIMEEVALRGECFLCKETLVREALRNGISSSPLHEGKHWYIKRNDFPYEGIKLHVMIVPNRHVTTLEDLSGEEFSELQIMVGWINKNFQVKGASMFVRYGDTAYTGATYTHMHFHVLHGDAKNEATESIKAKLGYKNLK